MELLCDMPLPLGEPHYAAAIPLSKLKPLVRYRSGTNSRTGERVSYRVRRGKERIEHKDGEVEVFGSLIRSHIVPEILEVDEGDEVTFHVTSLEQGAKLYERDCAACHGTHGGGNPAAGFPRIQGQQFNYLTRQFEWIRDGKRRNVNPAMVQAIKGYSHDDVWAVLGYVSRLQPPKDRLAPPGWENPDYD